MNDEFDPLEQELANLTPREPSAELRSRIANRLDRPLSVILTQLFIAGIVMGAVLFLWLYREYTRPVDFCIEVIPPPAVTPLIDESQPTLQAYRRAVDRSPEELDALLSKHASAGAESPSIHAFSRRELVSHGEP